MAVSKQDRFKKYERALLDAFPTWNELDKMVFGALGENLEAIVGQGALQDVVFRLLRWAESRGRLEELMRGARQQNPGNALLKGTATRSPRHREEIESGGQGAEIAGNVSVNGGTVVGRDQIHIEIHLPEAKKTTDEQKTDKDEVESA